MISQRRVLSFAIFASLLSLVVVFILRSWLFDDSNNSTLEHEIKTVLQHLALRRIPSPTDAIFSPISKAYAYKILQKDVDSLQRFKRADGWACWENNRMRKILREVPTLPHLEYDVRPFLLPWSDSLEKYFGFGNEAVFEQLSKSTVFYSEAKEVILTMAAGYDCRSIARFLHTLRKSGSTAKVVLFRNEADSACTHVFSSCGDIELGATSGFPSINIEVRRYVLALHWITKNIRSFSDCDRFLVCDFKDLIFQADPFQYLDWVEADLVITEEGYPMRKSHPTEVTRSNRTTIFNEPTGANFRWVKFVSDGLLERRLSNDFFKSVRHMPVLNSGVILGNLQGILRFLLIFSYICGAIDTSDGYAAGQGILMYSYYSGMLSKVMNVKVLPVALSFVAHCESYVPRLLHSRMKFDPMKNPFVNSLGRAYAIVHQINRMHVETRMLPWLNSQWNSSGSYC